MRSTPSLAVSRCAPMHQEVALSSLCELSFGVSKEGSLVRNPWEACATPFLGCLASLLPQGVGFEAWGVHLANFGLFSMRVAPPPFPFGHGFKSWSMHLEIIFLEFLL
ncbi:uncharacterized protein DS421_11g333010 [Arachis hypogaea]|nr:uncharacterized protein DS421_11g333010 [Arachis hypogaea]